MRILYENIADDLDEAITATSENENYPLTNLQDPRLSRYYRSESCEAQRLIFHKDDFTAKYLAIVGHNIQEPGSGSWTKNAMINNRVCAGVAYGNTKFVGVSYYGDINRMVVSDDNGLTWVAKAAPELNMYSSIAYFGNNTFCTVCWDGTTRAARSTDGGDTWAGVAAAEQNMWASVDSDGAGEGVAVAFGGTNRIMKTTDYGASWAAVTGAPTLQFYAVAYVGSGIYIAFGLDGGIKKCARSDDDGETWTIISIPASNMWMKPILFNDLVVTVSDNGTQRVMWSDDLGLTWALADAAEANQWKCLATDNNIIYAFSSTGNHRIMKSFDGVIWEAETAPMQNPFTECAYGANTFIALSLGEGAFDPEYLVARMSMATLDMRVQANDTDVWTSPSFSESITEIDDIIILAFDEITYNYYSLYVDNPGNQDDYLQIAHIFIGNYLQMPGMKPEQLLPRSTTSKADISNSGQAYGSAGYEYRNFEVNFPNVTDVLRKSINTCFDYVKNYKPFILLPWANELDFEPPIYAVIDDNKINWKRNDNNQYPWGCSIGYREVF